jgi:hypothetical protein
VVVRVAAAAVVVVGQRNFPWVSVAAAGHSSSAAAAVGMWDRRHPQTKQMDTGAGESAEVEASMPSAVAAVAVTVARSCPWWLPFLSF